MSDNFMTAALTSSFRRAIEIVMRSLTETELLADPLAAGFFLHLVPVAEQRAFGDEPGPGIVGDLREVLGRLDMEPGRFEHLVDVEEVRETTHEVRRKEFAHGQAVLAIEFFRACRKIL